MDRLWTPWRFDYIVGTDPRARKGVPHELAAWPGDDTNCVFCNLIRAVEWGIDALPTDVALKAAHVLVRLDHCYVCLNAFPYASGHLLIIPYRHTDSLAKLLTPEAEELARVMQRCEVALRDVYQPGGVNMGMNLGQAAGAGVANHLHMHVLPRWLGDTNFMTVTAETRVLPETLDRTWERVRQAMVRPVI